MLSTQVSAQEIENARLALVLIMTGIVMFWRVLLRALFVIILITAGVGAFVLLQSVHL